MFSVSILGFPIRSDVLLLGLIDGMLYGILGVGLVLVYRSSRIINFAYGDMGAFGATLLGVAVTKWGLPYWLAFLLALVAAAGVGAGSEVLVMRRLSQAPLVLSVIATLGLGQILLVASNLIGTGAQGSGVNSQNSFPSPAGFPHFFFGALLVTPAYSAMLILTPFVVLLLVLFLRRGRLGVAIRASAANPDAARMAGMAAGRMSALTWAISGALACYTVALILPSTGFTSSEFLGPDLLLRALTCAVAARMVNMPVALFTGLGVGVVEQMLVFKYHSTGPVDAVLFVAILVMLLLQRPTRGRAEDKGVWSAVQAFKPLPLAYRKIKAIRQLGVRVAIAAAVIALVIPEATTNTNASYFTNIAVLGIVGVSVTLITGLAGQLSLGQFAIAAVGAAAAYAAQNHGAPFVVVVLAAAVAGAVVSLLIGLPAIRIRGLMLAVTTLGFALACTNWLLEQTWVFGSGGGVLSNQPAIFGYSFDTGKRYYLVAFAILLLALWLTRNVWRGGVGRRLRAVRDNEEAARAFSIPATKIKLQAFVLSGVIAGLGGAVYFAYLSQQGPVAYPFDLNTNAVAAAVIGGLGFIAGPLLGALYLIGVPLWLPLDNAGQLASSTVWLVLVLLAPGGIGQLFGRMRDRIHDRLAVRAGLDPAVERNITPGGGVLAAAGGVELPAPNARRVPRGDLLLSANGLVKKFGGLAAVRDVTIAVNAGEILGLIGPNGAGKTTTFELLGGFTRPDQGVIYFEGRDITHLRPEQRAEMGLIRSFQDSALFPTMTVHECLMLAYERSVPTKFWKSVIGFGGPGDRLKEKRADALLAALGLLSYRDVRVSELSTGTRHLTELACLIALEPTLLLLDEPTSGIAQHETEALSDVLRNIKNRLDLTIIIIEHDIPMITSLADRIIAMDTGEVITVGTPAEVQANPQVIASYLGGDIRAIERSTRTAPESSGCGALTPSGSFCAQSAGPDGYCAQHRNGLSIP